MMEYPAIVGPYRIIRPLARGASGIILLAAPTHTNASRLVVIKLAPSINDVENLAIFKNEANVEFLLSHPNLVQILDFGDHEGQPYLVLEYIEGYSLEELLVSKHRPPLPLSVALYIACEVLKALIYAHQARDNKGNALYLIHRDVTPGNILISSLGHVKLTDFGLSKSFHQCDRTATGILKGKLRYMPLEQLKGQPLSQKSDLYAVGVCLVEMLLEYPMMSSHQYEQIIERHKTLHKDIISKLPITIQPIIERVLSSSDSYRYESAEELWLDCKRLLAHLECDNPVRLDQILTNSNNIKEIGHTLSPSTLPAQAAGQPSWRAVALATFLLTPIIWIIMPIRILMRYTK